MPVLVGAASATLFRLVPLASFFISTDRVETLVRNATDYGLNAVQGAVKGEMLTIPIGSAVIATAVQRAVDQAPAWLLKAAGGPTGIAEKVFRILHLEPNATAANTLAAAVVPGRDDTRSRAPA